MYRPVALASTIAALLLSGGAWARQAQVPVGSSSDAVDLTPADSIVAASEDPDLGNLAMEVLARNPRLAALTATAHAAEQRAPQVGSLPDPMASLTLFLMQPQTRVGPQQAAVGVSQRFPWLGKLKLSERAAVLEATAAWARVESLRVELVTTVRTLYLELQFLDREKRIVVDDKTTLEHYEGLAEARYASGVGIGQSVIKLQAEITKARTRLLDIEERRASLVAEINALRDRPEGAPVVTGASLTKATPLPPFETIRETALARRPELGEARALIDAATARVEAAKKDYGPDLTVGVSYAVVGKRDDTAGRLNPPEDNGRDVLGLTGGVSLPVWRRKLAAGVEEAVQRRLAAEEMRRATIAEIDGDLADLARRVPLIREELGLFDTILTAQAEESLQSAEAAYASGTVNALELLDAERVLLEVRIAAERARTDLEVATARLEGVAAAPLRDLDSNGSTS